MPTSGSGKDRSRYGIGEWYGKSFVRLSANERKALANMQSLPKKDQPPQVCIPRSTPQNPILCTKQGGVCSLRLYTKSEGTNRVSVAPGNLGRLRTTCPYRFEQNALIYHWIGETLVGTKKPIIVKEVGFLERGDSDAATAAREDVGRIDNVLVHPRKDPLCWCALEIQAVYFSGAAMSVEFAMLRRHGGRGLPFPAGQRRPDYRSSGPKRLMPQLQIKVPSLRRWGKKMAVVVDEDFFAALGPMDKVSHPSNADILWFVVGYTETGGHAQLERRFVRMTTLERAVEGLTAGRPVTLDTFEARIRQKLNRS